MSCPIVKLGLKRVAIVNTGEVLKKNKRRKW